MLTLSARRFSNFPARIHDVGVLFDLSIHDVDIISYLLGEKPNSIMVNGGKAMNEAHEDHVILSLKYPSGVVGVCETNWLTPMKVREVCITTDTHYVKINSLKQEIEKMSSSFANLDSSNLFQAEMKLSEEKVILNKIEPLATELLDFLESISVNKNPSVSGQAALLVKIVQAGLESLSSNKVIKNMIDFLILFISALGTYYVMPHSIRKLKENNLVVRDMYKHEKKEVATNAGIIVLFISFISISLFPLVVRILSFFFDYDFFIQISIKLI